MEPSASVIWMRSRSSTRPLTLPDLPGSNTGCHRVFQTAVGSSVAGGACADTSGANATEKKATTRHHGFMGGTPNEAGQLYKLTRKIASPISGAWRELLLQGDDGQLGPTEKAYGQDRSADAAAHVHLRGAVPVPARQVSPGAARQPERRHERNAHLAAVRVPRQRQRAMTRDLVEVGRRVKQRDGKRVRGHTFERCLQVGHTGR